MTRKLFSLLTAAAVSTLAACGGGGDGAPSPAPATSTPSASSSVVASVPASTYAPGSEELAAFTLLNAERQRCGFGQLTQSAALDAAAKAHATYQIVNNIVSHFENLSTNPTGFTGADAAARVVAQGYTGAGAVADEIAVIPGTGIKTGMGESGTVAMMAPIARGVVADIAALVAETVAVALAVILAITLVGLNGFAVGGARCS